MLWIYQNHKISRPVGYENMIVWNKTKSVNEMMFSFEVEWVVKLLYIVYRLHINQ